MNIFILFGQTATGKTSKAFELAKEQDGEIVNFDSRQIYKKLDIVTGKDIPPNSKFQISNIKFENYTIGYYNLTTNNQELSTKLWLYDIVDPKQPFSSAEYVASAEEVLKDIIARGKTPILVGGTGYYLYHLLYGVPKIDVPADWSLRKSLATKSVEELQNILVNQDAELFNAMNESDRMNPRRLIRRIEIASGGGAVPAQTPHETFSARFNCIIHYLPFFHCSPEAKQGLIRQRVLQRVENGAIEETERLIKEGYSVADPGLNAIGYQQIIEYIQGNATREQMIELWITKEMQYSKRQKTFFKRLFPDLIK